MALRRPRRLVHDDAPGDRRAQAADGNGMLPSFRFLLVSLILLVAFAAGGLSLIASLRGAQRTQISLVAPRNALSPAVLSQRDVFADNAAGWGAEPAPPVMAQDPEKPEILITPETTPAPPQVSAAAPSAGDAATTTIDTGDTTATVTVTQVDNKPKIEIKIENARPKVAAKKPANPKTKRVRRPATQTAQSGFRPLQGAPQTQTRTRTGATSSSNSSPFSIFNLN